MTQLELRKDLQNKLLKRREVEFIFENNSNPGFKGAKEVIVEKFKAKKENVIVKKVLSEFGKHEFIIDAFIYDSKEALEDLEGKQKEEAVETPVEESKSEEVPVEAPVEESKSEKSEDSKEASE